MADREPVDERQPPGDASVAVPHGRDRWRLIADLIAFQFKLLLDGLRDVLLSPVSIIATLAGLLMVPESPGRYFHALLRWGRKSDRWINLFGAEGLGSKGREPAPADRLVGRVEQMAVDTYRRGGMLASFKSKADQVIDATHRRLEDSSGDERPRDSERDG